MTDVILIALFALSVALSAVYSASEIANARANKMRFSAAAEKGDRVARTVCALNDNYVRSLSAILLGNNFVNIAASSIATVLAITYVRGMNPETAAGIFTTVVLLLFGETCPKILAAADPDRFARLFARPVSLTLKLFFPVIWAVEKLMGLLSPLWTPKEEAPQVTTEELREILEDIGDEGVFTESETELIRKSIEFSDTTAHEILTPRTDVTALDIDEFNPAQDLSEDLLRHSRIPVYRDSIDNIIGILHTRRLLRRMAAGDKDIDPEKLLVEPLFVHKTCPISTLIDDFKKAHVQIAVVVDEFGGTMGIVTLEDVLEEIVGDIYDEMDTPEEEIEQKNETHFTVDGSMNIYDMFEAVGYEPDPDFETEYTTAGGWATEILDRFPEKGDEFDFDNLHVTVLDAAERRVGSLDIEVRPKKEE